MAQAHRRRNRQPTILSARALPSAHRKLIVRVSILLRCSPHAVARAGPRHSAPPSFSTVVLRTFLIGYASSGLTEMLRDMLRTNAQSDKTWRQPLEPGCLGDRPQGQRRTHLPCCPQGRGDDLVLDKQ